MKIRRNNRSKFIQSAPHVTEGQGCLPWQNAKNNIEKHMYMCFQLILYINSIPGPSGPFS